MGENSPNLVTLHLAKVTAKIVKPRQSYFCDFYFKETAPAQMQVFYRAHLERRFYSKTKRSTGNRTEKVKTS
jgi:hypothetical protein